MALYKLNNKTAFVAFPNVCPRSMVDAGTLVKYLKVNGWGISYDLRKADMILLGACGFSKLKEDQSMEYLSVIKRKNRDSIIIVFGCLPGINEKRLLDQFNVIPISPKCLEKLDEIIGASTKLQQIINPISNNDYKDALTDEMTLFDNLYVKLRLSIKHPFHALSLISFGNKVKPLDTRYGSVFNVRISNGCREKCTYCAIKNAYGTLNSKPLETIIQEFRSGLMRGYSIFRLVAGDVGSYGQDIEINIHDLLKNIFDNKENYRIIWDDFNPKWLIKYFPELLEILERNAHKLGYVGFPIQSGSEKILELMKRGYTIEDIKKCMVILKQALPELDISTHILIGFPGETERDFVDTVNFCKDINFSNIQVYTYSDRPGTLAAQMPIKIPEKIKAKRVREFRLIFREISTIV